MRVVQRVIEGTLVLGLVCLCCIISNAVKQEDVKTVQTFQEIEDIQERTELTIQNLYKELQSRNVKYTEIVLSQAILETGWFDSRLCKTKNNLFGLYNSYSGKFFSFESWQDSIDGYIRTVQYKFDVNKYDCYYQFLNDIGYAEDPQYTKKLQNIVSKLEL